MTKNVLDQNFWNSRWENGETGWDIGAASSSISEYFLHVENKEIKILIPGCGNAHEAELLLEEGFRNITLLDIAPKACELILQKFSHHEVEVICEDFFEHQGKYDVIIEQTFFCALDVNLRAKYVEKMHDLLNEGGKIVGVLFNKDFANPFPPFGGSKDEYRNLFKDKFEIKTLEDCYNSIKPRAKTEVFINFKKK
jgi:SAM-dependent methyltransferase